MGSEEGAYGDVVKLFAIICLKYMDGAAELGGDISEKGGESGGNIGFAAERKSPHKMRVIIQYHKIISVTRITRNRRGPNITMKKLKRKRRNRGGRTKRKTNMFA